MDLAAILEPGYMDLVRRRQGSSSSAQVRRTKSALETGLVANSSNNSLQPVSMEVVVRREGQDVQKESVQVFIEKLVQNLFTIFLSRFWRRRNLNNCLEAVTRT